jgi:ABC-type molybdate transport system substrate-binding protein
MKNLHRLAVLSLLLASAPAFAQFAGPKVADAKPGDVRLIVTAAVREPMDAVKDKLQAAVGKPVVVEFGSARGNLKDEIMGGQAFEVAILLPDVNEQLLAAGKIGAKAFEIARVPIALGLRGDATIDVSTPEAIKKAMLGAASVKYSPTGAALLTVKKIMGDLQLAGKVKDNSATKGEVPLAAGEYEINIYPLSEIIPNKKLKNLGPVIPALQVPSIIQAVISAAPNDPKAAMAAIKFLQGPAINDALKADGMDKSTINTTLK